MATIAITITRTTTATATTITITVASVGESVAGLEDGSVVGTADWSIGGSTEATGHFSGCKESITTGHTCPVVHLHLCGVHYDVRSGGDPRGEEGGSACLLLQMNRRAQQETPPFESLR